MMYATDAFPIKMAADEETTEVFEQLVKEADQTMSNLLEKATNPDPE